MDEQPVFSGQDVDLELPMTRSVANPGASVRSQARAAALHILFVTPRYFPFMGGVENHVAQVAGRMAQWGEQVTVLTTNPGGHFNPRERTDGVNIVRVPAYPADRDYYLAPALHQVITRGDWDIVHVQSYHTLVAPLAMFSAWRARRPYVVTFHGGGHSSRLRNAARGMQTRLLRPLLARADRLVCIAEFERKFFQEQLGLPEHTFVTIPNGADLPTIPETAQPDKPAEVVIASIGRLERYKGHQHAIAALPFVLREIPNARLWIAGTGPYEGTLRQLATRLGVSGQVTIAAVPPHERMRMAHELAETSLVVLFSEYETHPIAVLEALALKRPVVVTKTSGLGELVERGLARGVALHSTPEEIARAMIEQIKQPQHPPALVLPNWDDCARGLLNLYRSLVQVHAENNYG